MADTYSIFRFYKDGNVANELIKTGLTLKEAQEHCQRDDTKGDGWFDGYVKEEIDYCGDEETIQKLLGNL